MTMTCFAGILAHQLINNVDSLLSFYSPLPQELRSLRDGAAPAVISIVNESPESTSTLTGDRVILSLRVLTDANQEQHHQIAYEKTTRSKGKRRTKTRPCVLCLANEKKRHLVGFGCFSCGIALCSPNASNTNRDCFLKHVQSVCWRSNRQTSQGFLLVAGSYLVHQLIINNLFSLIFCVIYLTQLLFYQPKIRKIYRNAMSSCVVLREKKPY